ncbi:VOC family protein [Pseudomonas sp. Gutcm_11s]|uniref:VOC family protein n=1 Tax=Pseudomonas sp. Gutcm_11s TaxID=3026088 RepID=UPI0023602350|nr:VOC family protein [Pseudomonas sp. Gutcm_11s]MDD0842637.1 VOC family protein [Pseudomonas sp. Gutcm_11s]
MRLQKIVPCLWFDEQAEEAAAFYVGIFADSRVTQVTRYGEAGFEFHGKAPGTAMTVAFELDGQPFTALNGGPVFRFNEAISLQIMCATQAEVDHYWTRLGEGGAPEAQQCGWLKDRFGLSWQVVPELLLELLAAPDQAAVQRATEAMLRMKRLDIAELQQAFAGE